MNKEHNSALYEQFNQDCQVIELKYEYPGYVGYEKYAIVTDLSTEELEKYKDILSAYFPYMIVGTYFSEARREFRRNEKKHEMRSLRGHFFAIDENFDEHHPECAIPSFEDLLFRDMDTPIMRAIEALYPKEKQRVIKRFFDGLSVKEIAKEENVSEAAVSQSVTRALEKISDFLQSDLNF